MIDRMWLLLTFGSVAWMTLIAAFFGWEGESPAWARLLELYSKALCINVGVVSIIIPWLPAAWRTG